MTGLSTFRSRLRGFALALMPALLLRALTPMGFMPMHDAQGALYLAFCPGSGDVATSMSMAMPAGEHAHHQHHDGAPTEAPQHEVCPYALSAGPAFAYAAPLIHASASHFDAPLAPHYPTFFLPTIDRAQSARAPPTPRIA